MGMGGAERMLVNLFRTLEGGAEVESRLCVLEHGDWFYDYRPPTEPIYLGFHESWRDIGPARRTIGRLRDLLHQWQPHILHTHLWIPHFFGAVAVRDTPVRQICHVHNTWDWMASRRLGFRFRRALYCRAINRANSRFIACSDAAGQYTAQHLSLNPARFRTVHYGIDVHQFGAQPAEPASRNGAPWVIGSAGRFVPMKGHEDLLRAAAELHRRGHLFRLRLVGDGPLRGRYEALIRELGIGDIVEMPGPIHDMPGFYRGIDVYVQSSHSAEGLPLSILEAMTVGRPIIAADVAGAREAVRDGQEGFLVPSHDVETLVDRIERCGLNPAMRAEIAERARARAHAQFSLEAMTRKIVGYYRDVLAEGQN